MDGGFAHPKLFAFLKRQQVEYVVAMASNPRLEKRARRLMGKARMLSWRGRLIRGLTDHVGRRAARTVARPQASATSSPRHPEPGIA